MKVTLTSLTLLCALAVTTIAADPNAAEAKLREQLRAALLQARTLQAQIETLQAEKTQLEQDKQTATSQAETLQKQLVADKDAADKILGELRDKAAAQGEQLAQTREALDKWKAAHAEVTGVAQKKESERARLAQEKIELERVVADQRTKNLAMYRIGSEILGRYEKFGLGTALVAREPFTGTMRVKLENLVQDYGDKLAGQRIKPEAGRPASEPAPTTKAPEATPAPKRAARR